MKILTVVVPCYNSQDYMEKCIDALLPGGGRLEIIIVDDGSTDKTGLIADKYAKEYPFIVKVVHQENAGHGEGINQGLKIASGKYFKVVDSDDRLSGRFCEFLDMLESLEKKGGADLIVTNYRYSHSDGVGDRSINYSNALPEDKIIGWPQVRRFRTDQLLSIHSCTFRTELMKKSGAVLPKHTSYEDDYMIHANLYYVKRIYYLDMDLYLYTIGREGQSVQEDVIKKKYKDQIKVTTMCYKSFPLESVKDSRLKQYFIHELFLLFGIAIIFARLNKTEAAEKDIERMWQECEEYDPETVRRLRRTPLMFLGIPGRLGREILALVYHTAHKVVRFN